MGGTGCNVTPDNPYLTETLLCSNCKGDESKKGKCDRCSNGVMYRMPCYKCRGEDTRTVLKCEQCYGTSFNYRKLGKAALSILEDVRTHREKLCSNCHGEGCKKCEKSGLDLQKASLREIWQTVQSSCINAESESE